MRQKTSSWAVEIDEKGHNVPAGRKFAETPRTDGLNSYGLTDDEEVTFVLEVNKLAGVAGELYFRPQETEAAAAAGISSASTMEQKAEFLEKYRADHPLATSFHELPDGDPSKYVDVGEEPAPAIDENGDHHVPPAAPSPGITGATLEKFSDAVLKDLPILGAHTPVEVAPEHQAQLPVGTVVTRSPEGELTASVPVDRTNNPGTSHYFHYFAEAGQEIHHLIDLVRDRFGSSPKAAGQQESQGTITHGPQTE